MDVGGFQYGLAACVSQHRFEVHAGFGDEIFRREDPFDGNGDAVASFGENRRLYFVPDQVIFFGHLFETASGVAEFIVKTNSGGGVHVIDHLFGTAVGHVEDVAIPPSPVEFNGDGKMFVDVDIETKTGADFHFQIVL